MTTLTMRILVNHKCLSFSFFSRYRFWSHQKSLLLMEGCFILMQFLAQQKNDWYSSWNPGTIWYYMLSRSPDVETQICRVVLKRPLYCRQLVWGTVIENNIYFSNLLILIEDHPVVLSPPSQSLKKFLHTWSQPTNMCEVFATSHLHPVQPSPMIWYHAPLWIRINERQIQLYKLNYLLIIYSTESKQHIKTKIWGQDYVMYCDTAYRDNRIEMNLLAS